MLTCIWITCRGFYFPSFSKLSTCYNDELMFGAPTFPRMRAWAFKDNLDADAFSWFFGQYWENVELVKPLARFLLIVFKTRSRCRLFFGCYADGAKVWRGKAVKRYEAVADEFLKRLLILIYMGSS